MENNPLLQAFDLVAATRRKKGLRHVFNPLAVPKVAALKKAITAALETPAATENLELREVLLTAANAIERHDALPAKKTVNVYSDPVPFDLFGTSIRKIGTKQINNPARRKIITETQAMLYKKLKPQLQK